MSNDIPTVPEPELLSARGLAQALGVTSATVRRWVRSGHLKPTNITYGGYYQFSLEDARRQLEAMRYVRPRNHNGPSTPAEAPLFSDASEQILDTDE